MPPSRRAVLGALAGTVAAGGIGALGIAKWVLPRIARPPAADGPPSQAALDLVAAAWQGIAPADFLDTHVHAIGLGVGGTGCSVHPESLDALAHPIERGRFEVYRTAAGISDLSRADQEYVEKLLAQIRGQAALGPGHGRHMLLAMDQVHDEQGRPRPELTRFHTPDAYVAALAGAHPDCFLAVASVHPYRADALEALDAAVDRGCVAVKWLPSAQRIDPASPLCLPFYEKLAELGLPLLTHAGHELAVEVAEVQAFGNPLKLRGALEAGVSVVVLHCASLGEDEDEDGTVRPSFELFSRLMEDPRWEGQLWGEVSALTQFNRVHVAPEVVRRDHIRDRLLSGTDYPLTAINALVQLSDIVALGLVDEAAVPTLREVFQHNAFAFDLALKRLFRADGKALPPETFTVRPEVFPLLAAG